MAERRDPNAGQQRPKLGPLLTLRVGIAMDIHRTTAGRRWRIRDQPRLSVTSCTGCLTWDPNPMRERGTSCTDVVPSWELDGGET